MQTAEVFPKEAAKDRLRRKEVEEAKRQKDEINDLTMIEGAGLGVAMGNAAPSVKAAANRETGHHDAGGAGDAIEKILSGVW